LESYKTTEEAEAPITPPEKKERKPVVEKKPVVKFGTQTETAKIIFCFRNGDKHHSGIKITLHPTKFKTFEQVLQGMTTELRLPTGPVMRVYTPDGKQLRKSFDAFETGGKYICCGAEKFLPDLIPTAVLDEPQSELNSSPVAKTEPKKPVAVKKPVVTKKPVTKFGTQTEVAKTIYVFPNGDKHHAGAKLTLHPTKFKTFDQVLQAMTTSIVLPTGAVRQVFTPDGKQIKDLADFEYDGRYIAAGAEKLKKDLISPHAWTKAEKPKKKEESNEEEKVEESNEGEEMNKEEEAQEKQEEKQETIEEADGQDNEEY